MSQFFAAFNGLDYALIGLVLLSLVISLFRGFLREAISLVTWFLAFVAALKFSDYFVQWFHFIPNERVRYIVCAVAVFVIVMIIGVLINKMAHALVTASGLGFFDRILGVVFGVARGLLIDVILLVIIAASPLQTADWYTKSKLAPLFEPVVKKFETFIPEEVKHVSGWMDKLKAKVSQYTH